ncbi:MAG: alpha/beta hydrolase [Bergeyella zoohelcum]|nr:alpha/beta hydrolase [Bergeyella zoohelcum]
MIFNLKKKEKTFNFIAEGEGKPIVLLQGLMGGLSNFTDLIKFFSERGYKVFFPELPIYDLSILNTNLTSISKFVAKFLEEIVKEPAIIIGNSMGGHIGLILTLSRPELVKYLVLTGSSGLYERSFGDSFPRKGDRDYIKKKTQEVFYDPNVATESLVDEVFSIVNDRGKGIKTVMLARSAIKHNMAKELHKIKVPTCIIWGKQDNVTPPEVAVDMDKLIPDSDLFWIDQCGHAAMMERPSEFNNTLYNWLKTRE